MASDSNTLPLMGRDYSYDLIDGELCLVRDTGLYSKVENGKITFRPDKSMPYGFIEVECKTLPEPVMLLLTHKQDYINLWELSEVDKPNEGEELAVIWTDSRYKNGFYGVMKAFMPRLWVMHLHKGYYEFNKAKKSLEDYHGKVPYSDFVVPIRDIKPDVFE